MKIAIVGAGISGIYAAYHLAADHEVTLYEARGSIGGHTDTHHITTDRFACAVDTGFIVFNEQNYPLFTSFIEQLGVSSRLSDMSFSVSNQVSDIEYNATSLGGLFCQRRNMVSPGFYKMLVDILRFYRESPGLLQLTDDNLTIGEYLEDRRYGRSFIDDHMIPMASALWSSPPGAVAQFPARYLVSFMNNHKMLQVSNRPVWRTIAGGSSCYLRAFETVFRGELLVNSPVVKVERKGATVRVESRDEHRDFDKVVLACHSDQALSVLADATSRERDLLDAIPYQLNEVTLHTDTRVLPRNPKAWASWNVVKPEESSTDFIVSYNMNLLQGIQSSTPIIVSLNADKFIDESKVLLRRLYHHPLYSPESLSAQRQLKMINGENQTYFAGAYLGWGFHEDGARSAQAVVDAIRQGGMLNAA